MDVLNTIGAREYRADTSMAGRPGRALADRAVDTYANNARVHSEADLDKLAASIRKWGWTMPALVDEEGVLLAGHLRVGAAAKLRLPEVPVIVARGWSEEEKQAYRVADNQLAARASWDFELLRSELRALAYMV